MTKQIAPIKKQTQADPLYGKLGFPQQARQYHGKTREMYFTRDGHAASIATNRLSAFNVVFKEEIEYKGAVLNLIAAHFLEATADIVPNWFRSAPNAITSVGEEGEVIPYEMIVRGYLAGSAARLYKEGGRVICGVTLPEGLKENDKLPTPIITPTRKSEDDEPITREEILAEGKVSKKEYELMEQYSLATYNHGQKMAEEVGLILVDTKYEFIRTPKGYIKLGDEVNTPDSSRYFYLEGYADRQAKGEKQKQLSKEFFREWLMEQGFGEKEAKAGQQPPVLTPEVKKELSERYIGLYERITGKAFPYEWADAAKDKDYVLLSSRLAIQKLRFPDSKPVVGIIMGSDSDLPIMDKAAFMCEEFGIDYEVTVVSAHRTPARMEEYAKTAKERGLKVIIAGAGGAAHLPGMVSAATTLPVIGVPIKSSNSIDGWDSILSILQMPEGIPTLTVGLNGSKNAGIAAARIIGASDEKITRELAEFKTTLSSKVLTTVQKVEKMGYPCAFQEVFYA